MLGLFSFNKSIASLSVAMRQYLLITANYWAFTLTDGALRMLVVLYFHQLGYSPLNIAMLFLFYEIFGVVTNLVGGWLGAKLGLNKTMNIGLALQIIALVMLCVPIEMLSIIYVMAAQALSGIAKDLNKMSAKSAIKVLLPENSEGKLYQWVATLTGSKNALKGIGFFLGGVLLSILGFQGALWVMATALTCVWLLSLRLLKSDLGKSKNKPKFSELFSKSPAINALSAARLFLFAARDVWFVVALPVYLAMQFKWDHWWVGGFMACWIIGYGIVQTLAPRFTGKTQGLLPTGKTAFKWAVYLSVLPTCIAVALITDFYPEQSLIIGLLVFGAIFAVNSSLHSYLIVSYADQQNVSLDVGFYYMANAMGRLLGTVLSGWVFQYAGLQACLLISTSFIVLAAIISTQLPNKNANLIL
ncbi:organoarsenical effux MFS transporter ArsJ [Pseudoalteromonas tunicata]|uniref:organoarsenical effux MFS transporter ArsJ n=1 Tax=Pseudoalteromonas tunicata TaxID=314281 RepID=UPI00273DE9E6|nr:organoarsenical effux MFS transporter ArsJ [Pseudoalteromonas tunicata]MDP4982218.1 organoarsenical effux MFS transporter ArsJ [Pseudoalteromonas tunicata]